MRPFNNNNYLCTGFLNIRTTQPQNKLDHSTANKFNHSTAE